MANHIYQMDESGLPAAAEALANAFFTDPLQNYTFPDDEERRAKSPGHFAAALRYGLKFGEVYAADNVAGASIWLKPGETDVTPERAVEGGFAVLPEVMGEAAFSRFFSAINFAETFHKLDAPEPHWYTMVLGVDPAFQGNGYGRDLLEPILTRARADGDPVYLETAQPNNISFYQKMGFRLLRELVEPTGGLKMWTFRFDG
jgi:ribosomal protein S18 acetylase RimI-like enzyme